MALPLLADTSSAQVVTIAKNLRWLAPIAKSAKCLPVRKIEWLAEESARAGGTKKVGAWLAARKLPNSVLEDTYLRISIQNGHLPREEAETMFSRLNGKPGFRTTLRKISGSNAAKSGGHMNELRLASAAEESQMTVVEIGAPFDDPAKKGLTDIDLLLKYKSKTIAIEAKDYLPTTPYPMDKFRADMETLKAFQNANPNQKILPVFSVTSRPADPEQWALLKTAAKINDIHLIVGDPQQQAAQLMLLAVSVP